MDMDTDRGSSGVSNRARQRFESETPEQPGGRARIEESESRQRLLSRKKRASLLIELVGNVELHQRVPSNDTHLSTPRWKC